jgi:uncharacterized membrane protein YphA (DoxX/SURF4 family)
VGLLVLRATVGVATAIQAGTYLSGHLNGAPWTWAVCCLAVAGGVLLLIGFLTPAVSILLALGNISISLSWLLAMIPNLFDANLTIFFVPIMTAIALLGPGAYSLDARLFGLREIIIPQAPRSPDP